MVNFQSMKCPLRTATFQSKESKQQNLYTDTNNKDISWKYSDSISEIREEWQSVVANSQDIFLNYNFLYAVQLHPPVDVDFFYFVIYFKGKAAGVMLFQSQLFEARKSIVTEKDSGIVRGAIRNAIANRVNFTALVNGNAALTGEHGFYFNYDVISKHNIPSYIEIITNFLKVKEFSKGKYGILHIVKDLDVDDRLNQDWMDHKYHKVTVQPNMILKIRKEWENFDGYLQAMSSKYRKNIRRGMKKSKELKKHELNLDQIESFETRIFELYQCVKDNASFNLFELNPKYFYSLKKQMGDDFKLFGYFHNEELVSFYTLVNNYGTLDAHFLGYEIELNKSFMLYFNMLLDMVNHGIENGYDHVEFARTAMEIKSSVGAEPKDMMVYIRYENKILNPLVGKVTALINPKIEWTQRHPFK